MFELYNDKVVFSRDTWEELIKNEQFLELVEDLEDSADLKKAIEETEYFVDWDEYSKNRLAKMNV